MFDLSSQILGDLDAGATLVVPSRQRAAVLRLAYAAVQLRQERELWRTPDVLTWGSWLEREAARAAEAGAGIPRLLRPAAEWLLWREVAGEAIRESAAEIVLTDSLAEGLRRAAYRLFEWRIPVAQLRHAPSLESTLLGRTLELFEEQCRALRAAGAYRSAELLQGWRPAHAVSFAGFTQAVPARLTLLERWGGPDGPLRERRCEGAPGNAQAIAAADPAEEIAQAAAWCRAQLAEDPRRRLLVVIPDLVRRRHLVARTFEQTLVPQVVLGTASTDPEASFAIEGGEPLAAAPLVRHALEALRFLTEGLDFPAFGSWLRGSFWSAPDPHARARLELWLRTRAAVRIDATELRRTLETAPAPLGASAAMLGGALERALSCLDAGPARTSQWATRFAAALAALGWPGARPLTSGEQQTRMRFAEVVEEFGELGPSLGTLSAAEAVRMLRDLAARVSFEPATGDPAVTLTDALSDPVVRYDGLWIAGLHADAWPAPVRVDPFIPLAAQKQAGMPETSPASALRQARALLALWHRSANELVVSWPRHGEDRECLASPLLAEIPGIGQPAARPLDPPLASLARGPVELESFEDVAGEPWRPQMLPAGTRSIEYQARCAFRAYAELRLACLPVEVPRPGVDARERGKLLHKSLELLWGHLRDSQGLRARSAAELAALVEDCTARALHECFGESALREQGRTLLREQRRTAAIVRELCERERDRPPFRVRDREARRVLRIAGTSLELRIDRIDELPDGSAVIFDYKTGKPQAQDWLSERVSHPQLLVYLLAEPERVAALATVHLAPARVSFRGIADRKQRLPGLDVLPAGEDATPEQAWDGQVGRWRSLIDRLATDFLAGHAALDPVPYACKTCHLHGFCRIAESAPVPTDAPGDD